MQFMYIFSIKKETVCLLPWGHTTHSLRNTEAPADLTFVLETCVREHLCLLRQEIGFIAALFVTARNWKQPVCPPKEQWIRKMRDIYTMEYY